MPVSAEQRDEWREAMGLEPTGEKPCAGWRRYKGLRRPKCNDGWGCHPCWETYNKRRYARMPQFNKHWEDLEDMAPNVGGQDELEEIQELCWQFFIRGLELSLGPPPK